jgi:hypothetical protein
MRVGFAQDCSGDSGRKGSGLPRALVLFGLVLTLAQPLAAQSSQGLRVIPLVRDDQVLVTFELTDGFTSEVRAAIYSGLKTTFTYTVDLRLDVPGWFDRTIASSVVTSSVEYQNLTRRHTIERRIDGRVDNTLVTDEEDIVRQWLTNMKQLGLFRTALLQPNREYYVRVNATARPSHGSILWPFGSGTSAQTKFTFIR